jgi:hypothetical protein
MSEREMHTDAGPRLTRREVARLAAAALAATSLGSARLTGVAAKESVAECQAKIEALRVTTSHVTTFTNPNDQTGLLGKLDSASTKLAQGKFADALQALTQFRDKVATLQSQDKIGPEDADALIAAANDAIACIQALIATT